MADIGEKGTVGEPCRRSGRTLVNTYVVQRNAKIELKAKVKKVSGILKKSEHERTTAEKALVKKNPDIVKTSQKNAQRLQATKDRVLEIEDEPQVLDQKCDQLADLIRNANRIVVYTGAGISTAASIPDYRGPNGVWTLLKKGQEPSAQDLSDAEPTFTHMSITKLFRVGLVKHIVSQNCDGLHIRSGYPRYALSEVHGNMFIECCYSCTPHKEYIRLFDVTERTSLRRHSTTRRCRTCGSLLTDTIVHFGEKGKIKSPYRWKEAVRAAKNSDLILCLGSSLKILRRYACLWAMDLKPHQRPQLVIVNLQWTPKDDGATLKINGRCDYVMKKVMEELEYEVPEYQRETDPIYKLCTPLRASELKTTSKKILVPPFLPSKTPSQVPKKSRQKKIRSHHSPRHVKLEKCSTVSSKSKVQEEYRNKKSSVLKNNLPFSALLKKSDIKVDWDTPILALDPLDHALNKEIEKAESNKTCGPNTEIFLTSKEDLSLEREICTVSSEKDSSANLYVDTTVEPESDNHFMLAEKEKIISEEFSSKNYEHIDVFVVEENQEEITDIYQVNLDGIRASLPPICRVQLSEKMQKKAGTVKCSPSLSESMDETILSKQCMSEHPQLTQPVPGTVVIDLEVVDEEVNDFSTGGSESAQVGMSFDNNILLINLNSKLASTASGFVEDLVAHGSPDKDTIYTVAHGCPDKDTVYTVCVEPNDSVLQHSLSPTPKSLVGSQLPNNTAIHSAVFDPPYPPSYKKKCDMNLCVGLNASSSSSSVKPSPFSVSKTSAQFYGDYHPSTMISPTSCSSPFILSPPSFNDKPTPPSFQHHNVFHGNSELPFPKHCSPPLSKPQTQIVSSPTYATDIPPTINSTTIQSLNSTTIQSLNSTTIQSLNILSPGTGMHIDLKSVPSQTMPKTSTPFANQGSKKKAVESTKRNGYTNLLQLLNTPVSIPKPTPADALHLGWAARKVIPGPGPIKETLKSIPVSDHPVHSVDLMKPNGQGQVIDENSSTTALPTTATEQYMEHGEARNLLNNMKTIGMSSSRSSIVRVVTPVHEHCENKQQPALIDPNAIINSSSICNKSDTLNKSANVYSSQSNCAVAVKENDSVPLCVLNMDDILKPRPQTGVMDLGSNGMSHRHPHRQAESVRRRSLSPLRAISLISSPRHEQEDEDAIIDGVQISTKASKAHNLAASVKDLPDGNSVIIIEDIHSYPRNVSNSMNIIDNSDEKMMVDTLHLTTNILKRSLEETASDVKSQKQPASVVSLQPFKPISQSSPVQAEKNNNNKGSKSRKRTVDKTPSNKNIKVSCDSVPGWFGKGLAIKIKRKKKRL